MTTVVVGDARLAIPGRPLVAISKNVSTTQTTFFGSGQPTGAQQVINCQFPDSIVIDTAIRLQGTLRYSLSPTFAANAIGSAPSTGNKPWVFTFGDAIAPRAFPLHCAIQSGKWSVGNADSDYQQLFNPVLARLVDDENSQQWRTCASRPDVFYNNQDAYGSAMDTMAAFGSGSATRPGNGSARMYWTDANGAALTGNTTTGNFQFTPATNCWTQITDIAAPATPVFYFAIDSSELLMMGGLQFGSPREPPHSGLARILKAALTLNLDSSAAKTISTRLGSGATAVTFASGLPPNNGCSAVTASYLSSAFANFGLQVTTLGPAMGVPVPPLAYHPTYRLQASNPATASSALAAWPAGGSLASPTTTQLVTQTISLSVVPSRIFIYARPAGGNIASSLGTWRFGISSVSISYGNGTYLTNAPPAWLYQESVRCGLNMSYPEWLGYTNTSAGFTPLCGPILVLEPGKSFEIPGTTCPGSQYNTQLVVRLTVYNQTPASATPELVLVTEESMQTRADKGQVYNVQPIVAGNEIAAAVPNDYSAPMTGGSWLSKGREIWNRANELHNKFGRPAMEFAKAVYPHLGGAGVATGGVLTGGMYGAGAKRPRMDAVGESMTASLARPMAGAGAPAR